MYRVKTPGLLKSIFKKLTWTIPVDSKTVFLTFDDGPTPQVTEFVLDCLDQYDAKATFFCLGKNIQRHPSIFNRILDADQGIGNHTYNHKNGWKTNNEEYYQDISAFPYETKMFRPPYGRITLSQINHLQTRYSIIMWDVLSGDFDKSVTKERCKKNVLENAEPGSIVVFHDSVKARDNITYSLPRVLKELSTDGYRFAKLPPVTPSN